MVAQLSYLKEKQENSLICLGIKKQQKKKFILKPHLNCPKLNLFASTIWIQGTQTHFIVCQKLIINQNLYNAQSTIL